MTRRVKPRRRERVRVHRSEGTHARAPEERHRRHGGGERWAAHAIVEHVASGRGCGSHRAAGVVARTLERLRDLERQRVECVGHAVALGLPHASGTARLSAEAAHVHQRVEQAAGLLASPPSVRHSHCRRLANLRRGRARARAGTRGVGALGVGLEHGDGRRRQRGHARQSAAGDGFVANEAAGQRQRLRRRI